MPIETKIDAETSLRTHVVTGAVQTDEYEAVLEETYRRPDYRPAAGVLWDVREADLKHISRHEIKRILDFVMQHRGAPPGVRTAIVVGRDLDYGLARMAEQFLEAESPSDVMVFRDTDEGMAWLGGVPVEGA